MADKNQDLENARQLADEKLNNIMQVATGSLPNDEVERRYAVRTLQQIFGVDFDEALQHYIKYQKSNPISRTAIDLGMKAAIAIHKTGYMNDVNNKLDEDINSWNEDIKQDPERKIPYSYKLVTGLKNLLSQPSISDQIAHKIMDFRNLDKPFPLVTSIINYPMVQAQQPQVQPQVQQLQ